MASATYVLCVPAANFNTDFQFFVKWMCLADNLLAKKQIALKLLVMQAFYEA